MVTIQARILLFINEMDQSRNVDKQTEQVAKS